MPIPQIPLYVGDVPDRNAQEAPVFTLNSISWLDYQVVQIPATNVSINGINVAVLAVESDALIASNSASSAQASEIASEESAQTSQSNANFKGRWSDATGAATVPSSYSNNGKTWQLLQNIADITADEPMTGAANWQLIDDVNMSNVSMSDLNNPLSQFFTGNRKSAVSAPNNTESDVSVSRAGVATIWDRYGVLRSIGSNTLRKNDKGFYFEGPDTNLILFPEDATNVYWNLAGITPSVTTADWYVSGNVSRLTETAALGKSRLRRTSTVVTLGGVKTFSCVVEPDANRKGLTLLMQGMGVTGSYQVNFNLDDLSFVEISTDVINTRAYIEEKSENVFYIEINAEGSAPDTTVDVAVFFSDVPSAGDATYMGDGVSGINITAITVSEAVSFGTSYIKNTGIATTRISDTVDSAITDNLPNLSKPWAFITGVNFDGLTSTDSAIWGTDTAESERLSVSGSGNLNMRDSDGVEHSLSTGGMIQPKTDYELIVSYDESLLTAYIDGVLQLSVAAVFNPVDSGLLPWGKSSTGNRMYGYLNKPRFITRSVTADEAKIQ